MEAFAENSTVKCPKCGLVYCPDLEEDREYHQETCGIPPHHERHPNEVAVKHWQLNFPNLVHTADGGRMEVVKLWVDPMEPYREINPACCGDPSDGARIVLGLKCSECGYVNALKFYLTTKTEIHNFTTKAPWLMQGNVK